MTFCALLFHLGPWVTAEAFIHRRDNGTAP
jgi:hypothetical protein